ncbi:MAG: hypothetical protein ACJ8AT_32055 [Hyalangium sp.]|uniref:hypothetical protein n=1 Tax=Hyalangium sp. TaxID=2028555 RepID=UPI003899936A
MAPPLSFSFAAGPAMALLLCFAGPARAQQGAPPDSTASAVEEFATHAYEMLTAAYYLQYERAYAVGSNAAVALMQESQARGRAPGIEATLRAEQQRLTSTGIRMAVTGVTSARRLLPGMEIMDGELGLALCHDAPRVLPIQVKAVRMDGVEGPGREVSVACDADVVIVGLAASAVRAAPIQWDVHDGIGEGSAQLDDSELHVRASGYSSEGVWVAERPVNTPAVELKPRGSADSDEVRIDVPGLKSNGVHLQPVFVGDLNGDGRLDAVIRFAAVVEDADSVGRDFPEGFIWRLVLSNGPDAPLRVAAWAVETRWW